MAPQTKDRLIMADHARRARATRAAFGHTQYEMCMLMGSISVKGQAWDNYESGRRRISIDHAMTLCKNLGLTMDWFYFGDLKGLPADVARKLRAELIALERAARLFVEQEAPLRA